MSASTSAKDFRVAIVGGGMCGLACAVGLAHRGIRADVFEATPKFDEVGAGVDLGPNALRALKGLGVLDAVLARSDEAQQTARRMLYMSGTGAHEQVYDYETSSVFTAADNGIGIYRQSFGPVFLAAVLPLLPDSSATHFNKRCTSISTTASGSHCIHFADGTTHEADLVIGADGIKSISRNVLVDPAKRPLQFTNTVAYRGLLPIDTLRQESVTSAVGTRPCCFIGIDKHIIAFPIKSGKIVNIVAFVTDNSVPVGSVEVTGPWVKAVPQQELLDSFDGWGHDVQAVLKHMKSPSKWCIHALTPLDAFVRGKIALVGDAAHAMTPHLGSGVGQGFEDVFVLCELLGHSSTNLSNLEAVLKAYDAIRQPRANMVLKESFRAGVIYENFGKAGYATGADIEGHLAGIREPIWRHNLDGDVTAAIASLQKQGSFPAITT
ncbi:FAD/NAD-P-binding domain-containing protein [Mycena albidolilacea]|uniref:FAD/NAD-P-binding domain-containing protein n=1 Tax=Mycena albidolilacea TaxID=1033008 RepID=A0AAD6Z7U2_9AGAR|nr:FAD/NAD-P-binding domain-containing protein [Mycena albidolilacea]